MYIFAIEWGLFLTIPIFWTIQLLRLKEKPKNFGRYLGLSVIYPAFPIGIVAIMATVLNQNLSEITFVKDIITIIIFIWTTMWVVNLVYVFKKYLAPLIKIILETKPSSKK